MFKRWCAIAMSLLVVQLTSAQDATPTAAPPVLWSDATATTIGTTAEWTNKVELADLNGDGWVDILFANGGDYETPGTPVMSRVFLNRGPDMPFEEATTAVFGDETMLARVIKVRDVNADSLPDVMVGTVYETQSRLFLQAADGTFSDATSTHVPQMNTSVGDMEFGDVDLDGDLDLALAAWGDGSPMSNSGGRTMLWLNDGSGVFSDVTAEQMPDVLVRFSWEMEVLDIDNDYDLDMVVSCKKCIGSFLFENGGDGHYEDVSKDRMPEYTNNYEFEAMDLNGDDYLDLVTVNDGYGFKERIFINTGGAFLDATDDLWPSTENKSFDDNMVAFLDYDSDQDSDFIIGSLDGPDRLIVNDGSGHLSLLAPVIAAAKSWGTLGIALADLNGDHRLDLVEAQGEAAFDERIYLGKEIAPDTAAPSISLVEEVDTVSVGDSVTIRARVHDWKSPTMPHDWQSVSLRWTQDSDTQDIPMEWYGEYLWRASIAPTASGDSAYQICAVDVSGNEACSESHPVDISAGT